MSRHLARLADAALARWDSRRPRRCEPASPLPSLQLCASDRITRSSPDEPVLHSDDGVPPAPRRGELGFSERGAYEDEDMIFEDTPLGGAPAKAHKRAVQRRSAYL